MNGRKNGSLLKLPFKIFVIVISFASIFNSKIFYSYIAGALKSSWYNWTGPQSQDATCTLANPFFEFTELMNDRCFSCESIITIPRLQDVTYQELEINYIKQNRPIIITDAMNNWKTDFTDIFNITETYEKQSWMPNYKPCSLSTNFDMPTSYILDYLTIASHFLSDHWFIQWKNCDLRAVKVGRQFYEQPYFVQYYLPAPQINWIILSYKYKSNMYHEIKIEGQRLIQFMQIRGSFKLKLSPRQKCHGRCITVTEILNESQILLVNSNSWHLQYKPLTKDINVAIVTENGL